MVKRARTVRYLCASVLVVLTGGCGIISTDRNEPKKAWLEISEPSTESLEISTSLNFLVRANQAITFEDLTVDTVPVPYEQEYDIREYLRFYVLAKNIESETISFRMKVTIDNRKVWYNEMKTLEPEETAQFVYRYTQPVLY